MHLRPSPDATVATNPIRLLLVDDKVIVREGVRALLEHEPGLQVVGVAASIAEAIALEVRPDVVITDLALPDAQGGAVIGGLRRRFGRAAIFALVDRDRARDDDIVLDAPNSGVCGYALKTATPAEFVAGLRTVAQGVQYVQPSLRMAGNGAPAHAAPSTEFGEARSGAEASESYTSAAIETLTEKEREVMHLLVLGHTNAEIANLCSVSLRTVEARRARVLQKLGVRTRAELVRVGRGSA